MFVVIAPAGLTVALQKRMPTNSRIMLFKDSDVLPAWNTIVTRRPTVIALDERFVATSRGAALIAQVHADPNLGASLRVLTLQNDEQIVRLYDQCAESPEAAILSVSRPLDAYGAREQPRFKMIGGAKALMNGEQVDVLDLSATGIRLISAIRLRPTEEFRLTLFRDNRLLRLRAVTAWSTLQTLGTSLAYHVGAQFLDADPGRIAEYCEGGALAVEPVFIPAEDSDASGSLQL